MVVPVFGDWTYRCYRHPSRSCLTITNGSPLPFFHSESLLIISTRNTVLFSFPVSIGTHQGWKSLAFWFLAFGSIIKNKGIVVEMKQFCSVFSSWQALWLAWIPLHFIKLCLCLSLQFYYFKESHCSPVFINLYFLISSAFARWAWNFSVAWLISEPSAECKLMHAHVFLALPCKFDAILANVDKNKAGHHSLILLTKQVLKCHSNSIWIWKIKTWCTVVCWGISMPGWCCQKW